MTIDPALIVTLALGMVGSGGIGALIKLMWDRRDGTEDREVRQVERITAMWEKAEARASSAESRARRVSEHASDLRRILMEKCGYANSELPEWPKERD